MYRTIVLLFFFFNDTATTEIYTLSLHDALPISKYRGQFEERIRMLLKELEQHPEIIVFIDEIHTLIGAGSTPGRDRKSTRLNSSHANISYAVFCLKKKKINDML